jgi:hypothetical protein
MFPIEPLRFAQKLFILHRKLECHYYDFRKKYQNKVLKYLKISDISFVCAYLFSVILDATITLLNIQGPGDESHPFTSFMMQKYGVQEGLLRVVESWRFFKGEAIDMEVRLGLVYVYLTIGISKHMQGVLSWL